MSMRDSGDEPRGAYRPSGTGARAAYVDADVDYIRPYEDRDTVRWGPIVAGLATTITTLVVLTVLGLAVGLSAFEPTADGDDVGTAASIWGVVAGIVAFLVGGIIAGWTSRGYRLSSSVLNGFLVGALALVLMLWLITTGAANILGAVGTNIQEIVNVTTGTEGASIDEVDPGQVLERARGAYDEAESGAWWTFIGLLVGLGAAAAGGAVGHAMRDQPDTVTETI